MSNWTQADIDAIRNKQEKAKAPKPSKYRNVKVEINGEKFDSKREANYYLQLKMREKAGEIEGLERQREFPLYAPDLAAIEQGQFVSHEICRYRCDFYYRDLKTGVPHTVDAKGKRTATYILKAKWMLFQNGITVEEV